MAAEYEVNIKINSQQIERQLEDIDKAISKIGKPKGGGSRGRSGISSLSPTREDLKASADYQKALQGVLKAGRDAEKVFGNLRKTAQSAMVAGANEARQLAAAAAGAPLKSQIRTRPQSVTRASADAAAKQLEAQIRAAATLEKQMVQEVAAFEMRADKRVLEAGLHNDRIEFQQKVDDIVKFTDLAIKESKREGKAFDEELRRRDRTRRATQRDRRKRFEGVALGAGFPLLFGGGAGSVIGGGLGGLTGSFGAQIALSALGQQVDKFVAGMVDAGKALTSVGGAADFMAEKSLFSSDSMQFRIEKLIEEGEVSRAAALMTQEMAKQVGGSGLKALKDLGTEASKMGKLFGTVMLRIQAFMAQALTPLIKLINSAIGGMVAQNQLDQMLAEAGSPERRAAILARSQELRGTKKQGRAGITRGDFTMEMLQTLQSEFPAIIPEGAAIEPTQLELLRAADTQSSQGEREEARIQKRLGRLEEERKKVFEISRFKDKIAAAEMSRDEQLVIRLQGEQKIAEIEAQRKKDLVDITDQRLIDQININAATEKLAAVRDTERELAEFDRERRQQRLDDMQKFIEQQYELNEAVKQQAALAEGIAQAMGQGMTQSFDLLINGAKNWGSALRDIAANVLRDIARQLIQIYIIEQSIGFLKSFITPFSPSTPLGAGGGQVGRFGTLGPNYGIPQFANGGNPPVGRPSIVGERGPELFVPRTAGTIIPNHAMGGANVTVNVDASGSSVQGDGPSAQQLGKAIGAAVQAELIKQKRPGGLLTR